MRRRERALRAPRIKAIVASLAVYLMPAPANAHTALLGVGGFWSGVAHLLTSPDQLALLLGLAIWTSFQDERLDARVIGASFVAVLAGALIGAGIFAGTRLNVAPAGAALMIAAIGLMMLAFSVSGHAGRG